MTHCRESAYRIWKLGRKPQQLPCGSRWLGSALLPVFQRPLRHAQCTRKFRLRQTRVGAGRHQFPARTGEHFFLFHRSIRSLDTAPYRAILQHFELGLTRPAPGSEITRGLEQFGANVALRIAGLSSYPPGSDPDFPPMTPCGAA